MKAFEKNNPNFKHGLIKHPLYQIWKRIKRQCNNPNSKDYIGNNIQICNNWLHFNMFYDWAIKFWTRGKTLIRLDINKNFEPDNCIFTNISNIKKQNANPNKARQTALNKYGVEHYNQLPAAKEKVKRTNIEKYGVSTPLQLVEIKKQIKQTNIIKYGIDNPAKLTETKKKIQITSINKYGVDHHMKTEASKEKVRRSLIKSGYANEFNGKNSGQLAKMIGISRSGMNARIRKYGMEVALLMDKRQSAIESIFEQWLQQNNIQYQKQVKIDKYIADFVIDKLIIEVDGLYWHSDAVNKNKKYHKEKKLKYKEVGYDSLFFREDEINTKFDIVKSIVLNKLGKSTSIFARKCIVKEVSKKDRIDFVIDNHLMGKGQGKAVGLYYNNELVTILQYTIRNGNLDISRFCHKKNTTVVGCMSKLLTFLTKTLQLKSISTFIDLRYGCGEYLNKFGFTKTNEDLSFRWIHNDKTYHRLKFKGNSGYDKKCYKIWDCGQAKYNKIL